MSTNRCVSLFRSADAGEKPLVFPAAREMKNQGTAPISAKGTVVTWCNIGQEQGDHPVKACQGLFQLSGQMVEGWPERWVCSARVERNEHYKEPDLDSVTQREDETCLLHISTLLAKRTHLPAPGAKSLYALRVDHAMCVKLCSFEEQAERGYEM